MHELDELSWRKYNWSGRHEGCVEHWRAYEFSKATGDDLLC
jgi:hypothetical protein